MSKLAIATASNALAQSNLRRSLVEGVPLAALDSHPALATLLPMLRERADGGRVRVWGSVAGTTNRHRSTWQRIEAGDWMAFWVDGGFRFAARICGLVDSGSVADLVWAPDPTLGSYRYLTFFDVLTDVSISASAMSAALGYRPDFIYRGYFVPSPEAQHRLAEGFGNVETFLHTPTGLRADHSRSQARELLTGLVGTTIHTVTGRPNTILEVLADDVVVATTRSPAGQRVPIEWVDDALARILRDGAVEVSVESLRHRSAFVGAFLLTLPGAAVTNSTPPRVVIGPDLRGAAPIAQFDASSPVGSQYRPALVPQVRSDSDPFTVDPAVVERGLAGHSETKNALATAVRASGFDPRSPRPDEASFDLAWSRDGIVYVAEVKSTTDMNEERQLRLGLGQVLRYRHLLQTQRGAEVRAVLVTEREPRDPSWSQLCDDLGVTLTFPPTFDALDV